MKTLAGIVIVWFVVLIIGLGGMFSAQPGLMSVCFFAWTPLAVAFGHNMQRAFRQWRERIIEKYETDKSHARRDDSPATASSIKQRVRRIEG